MARRITAGFGLALVVLIVVTFASLRALDLLQESAEATHHTQKVVETLGVLSGFAKDAETGQRGYLLTSKPEYLEPYREATTRIPQIESTLLDLLKNDSEQQQRAQALYNTIGKKLAELAGTVALENQGKHDDAVQIVHSDRGHEYMTQIRDQVSTIVEAENRALGARETATKNVAAQARALLMWGILGLMLALATAGTFIVRSVSVPVAALVAGTKAIASGAYEHRVVVDSDDELRGLANAFNAMAEMLAESTARAHDEEWLQTQKAALGVAMQDQSSFEAAASAFLSRLTQATGAAQGAVFVRATIENPHFHFVSGHAFKPTEATAVFADGEGLLGQVAHDQRALLVDRLPEDYFLLRSALGQAAPQALLLAPSVFQAQTRAVTELGLLGPVSEIQKRWVNEAAEFFGIVVNTIAAKLAAAHLLEEQRTLSEELQNQHAELEQQQQALEVSNASLSAQTRSLRDSERAVRQTNQALEEATATLELRARELEQTSSYKNEFMANMSHELRTPLNSLLLLSNLLAENKHGHLDGKEAEYARVINASGRDLLTLIDQVLDLAKIEAHRLEVHADTISFPELVQQMKDSFSAIAEEKGIDLSIVLAPDLPAHLSTDSQRLQQALRNLLSNALKFTEKGRVSLRIARASPGDRLPRADLSAERTIVFTVEDTGIGIPGPDHARVFEAFVQADGSTSRRYGGSGLGLAISRQLAQLLGGDITLQSEVGRGSRFTIFVPEKTTEKAAGVPARSTGTPTLLVVEDDLAFASVIGDFAEERHFRVLKTALGEEVQQLARTEQPSAIVLDIRLPDMSGLDVLRRLKSDPATASIPVHALTAYDYEESVLAAGAQSHYRKPIDKEIVDRIFQSLSELSKVKGVLVIEDDPAQCLAICAQITAQGLTAQGVHSGEEARQLVTAGRFQVAVLDLGLPDASGFDLLDLLSERGLRSIVYTGRELTRAEETRLSQKAAAIITKNAHSAERLRDELALFFHRIEHGMADTQNTRLLGDALADKKILIVDDDMRNVFALTSLLEANGAQTSFAENGRQALERLNGSPAEIDLVLMDMMMPEMDGYEAMRQIRADTRFEKLPIIAVTAKAMSNDRDKTLKAGASDYVTKPVDSARLLSLLRIWLHA